MSYRIITGRNAQPCNKFYKLNGEKEAESPIYDAVCVQHRFEDAEELAKIVRKLSHDEYGFLVLGEVLGIEDGMQFRMVTSKVMQALAHCDERTLRQRRPVVMHEGLPTIARLKEYMAPGSVMFIDRDNVLPGDFDSQLEAILPGLSQAPGVEMLSNSARILRQDGSPLYPEKAANVHRLVLCAQRIPDDLGERIEAAAMRAGLAWPSPGGSLEMVLDPSVWDPTRISYDGKPRAEQPLTVSNRNNVRVLGRAQGSAPVDFGRLPGAGDYDQLAKALGLEITRDSTGALVINSLRWTDEIEIQGAGSMTLLEAKEWMIEHGVEKVRTQAMHRPESTSWNGILRLSEKLGGIMYYDNGRGKGYGIHGVEMMSIGSGFTGQTPTPPLNPAPMPPVPVPVAPAAPGSEGPLAIVARLRSKLATGAPLAAQWIIPGLIPVGPGIVSGPRGNGKTTLLATLAAHATGLRLIAGFDNGPFRRVAVISEDPAQLWKILHAYTGHSYATLEDYVLVIDAARESIHDLARKLSEIDQVWQLPDRVDPSIMRRPLIVVDTVAAVADLEDHTNAAAVSEWMLRIKGACENPLLVAHASKEDAKGTLAQRTAAGSQAFESMVNYCLVFGREGADITCLMRLLIPTKARVRMKMPQVRFTLRDVEITLLNEYKVEEREVVGTLERDASVQVNEGESKEQALRTQKALEAIETSHRLHRARVEKAREVVGRDPAKCAAAILILEEKVSAWNKEAEDDPKKDGDMHIIFKLAGELEMTESAMRKLYFAMVEAEILTSMGIPMVKIPESQLKARQWGKWYARQILKKEISNPE